MSLKVCAGKKIIKAYDLVSQVLMELLASQNKTIKEAMEHKK